MLSSTNGHQMPQKANSAAMVRLFQTCAVRSGNGNNAGTTSSTA